MGLSKEQRHLHDHTLRELERIGQVHLDIAAIELFAWIGAMQLALRHPQFPKQSGDLVRRSIRRVQQQMPPAIAESIALGWSKEADVPRDVEEGKAT